MSITFRNPI
ncbi:hypothetical protein EC951288_3736A, partial [Escherichia coli 95.1288]